MLAGYITASTVDLARVREKGGEVYLYDHQTFKNSNFSDFESILNRYYRKYVKDKIGIACLGAAGPVIENEVSTTNLPWHLKGEELHKIFSIERVMLVNDLMATGYGLFALKSDRFFTINEGISGRPANMGILAAGTGLGEAILTWDGEKYTPYAYEGGHTGFAPCSEQEAELWEYLYAQFECVEVEDVLSLEGIERLYRFLVERERAVVADWLKKSKDKAGAIIEQALAGKDDIAVMALDLYIEILAAEVGNLALKGMTLGGIFLGGQIAPQIITALEKGKFMRRFTGRRKMASLLAQMPVSVILDSKTALLGAASMALSH